MCPPAWRRGTRARRTRSAGWTWRAGRWRRFSAGSRASWRSCPSTTTPPGTPRAGCRSRPGRPTWPAPWSTCANCWGRAPRASRWSSSRTASRTARRRAIEEAAPAQGAPGPSISTVYCGPDHGHGKGVPQPAGLRGRGRTGRGGTGQGAGGHGAEAAHRLTAAPLEGVVRGGVRVPRSLPLVVRLRGVTMSRLMESAIGAYDRLGWSLMALPFGEKKSDEPGWQTGPGRCPLPRGSGGWENQPCGPPGRTVGRRWQTLTSIPPARWPWPRYLLPPTRARAGRTSGRGRTGGTSPRTAPRSDRARPLRLPLRRRWGPRR